MLSELVVICDKPVRMSGSWDGVAGVLLGTRCCGVWRGRQGCHVSLGRGPLSLTHALIHQNESQYACSHTTNACACIYTCTPTPPHTSKFTIGCMRSYMHQSINTPCSHECVWRHQLCQTPLNMVLSTLLMNILTVCHPQMENHCNPRNTEI